MRRALLAVLLAFAASAPAGAALHHWRLSGVAFDDGATARGSFTYDDATATVVSWHVSVDGDPNYLEFTYMPGVSTFFFQTEGAATTIVFCRRGRARARERRAGAASFDSRRRFRSRARARSNPLDLVNYNDHSGGLECFNCGAGRIIVAGSLVPGPPADVAQADAIEFYHAGLDHYFITADGGEVTVLDTGGLPGWTRTGERFRVYHRDSPNDAPFRPVCRFYGLPAAGIASHFYSADPVECLRVASCSRTPGSPRRATCSRSRCRIRRPAPARRG